MDMMIETKCPVCGTDFEYDFEYRYELDDSQHNTETITCSKCSTVYKEEVELLITLDITKSQKIVDDPEHDFVDNCSGDLFANQESVTRRIKK